MPPKQEKQFTQITGKVRIYEKEIKKDGKDKFYVYSTSVGKKEEDGKYVNAYVNVYLSKEAVKTLESGEISYTKLEGENSSGYYEGIISDGWLTSEKDYRDKYPNKVALFINEITNK